MSELRAELIVEARLLDTGPAVPAPGIIYALGLMRYAVLRVTEGSYDHPEIHVAHDRPALAAPVFALGTRHRLELSSVFPAGVTVLGVTPELIGRAFFCLRFESLDA